MNNYESSVASQRIFLCLIMLLRSVLSVLTHFVMKKQNRIEFISRGPMGLLDLLISVQPTSSYVDI
jgi:hypothetical protein